MTTYAMATLGCKVNQYESERIDRELASLRRVAFGEPADFYIINTCGVTMEAERKARQMIRRARRASPTGRVVLTGCYNAADEARLRDMGVDIFVPQGDKAGLPRLITEARTGGEPAAGGKTAGDGITKNRAGRSRAFVKVQDGCEQRCSYCAIPDFRGRPVSMPVAEVVAEINDIAGRGIPEVVLTGIHLGLYGSDFGGEPDLCALVAKILEKTDIPRIRLSSIEPPQVTEGLIELVAAEERIANHLHLPLQSGSDDILRAMNRPYSAADFLATVERARGAVPRIAITTDVMVGFPGESENDFAATLDLVNRAAFSRAHVFKYSRRPGTPAADFPGQIEPAVKSDRGARVEKAAKASAAAFAGGFVDSTVRVTVERGRDGTPTGLTGEYLRVKFNRPLAAGARLLPFWVERCDGEVLIGGGVNE